MRIAFLPVPGSFRCSKSDRIVAGLCWFCQFFSRWERVCARSVRVPFSVPLFFFFPFFGEWDKYMAVICQHFYNKSTPKRNQQHNKFNIGNLLWFSTKISNISEMSHGVAVFPHDIFVSFMVKGTPNLAAIFFALGTEFSKHFITGWPDTKLKFIYSSLWTIFHASILVPTLPNVGCDALRFCNLEVVFIQFRSKW